MLQCSTLRSRVMDLVAGRVTVKAREAVARPTCDNVSAARLTLMPASGHASCAGCSWFTYSCGNSSAACLLPTTVYRPSLIPR